MDTEAKILKIDDLYINSRTEGFGDEVKKNNDWNLC